ncbi:hypothetical protein DQ04_00211170 [Trypanosoma grayi]|uniref:hypothetical protein n=1 Tax=Trypanosoma grayi TaxID=71804 RepID=UPI0004F48A2D|nr:hypothetical protein DQ04_00211170 [Trypanosoma grayi]KEG15034.1 hypothetical protein DQ04_00211170 [Trypanosoma grayi]
MLTSSLTSEDGLFRQRLDSINKEMQAIIERTAIERDRLFRTGAMASLPWSIDDATKIGGAELVHPLQSVAVAASANAMQLVVDEATVRRIVTDEMKGLKTMFQQMLSEAVSGVHSAVQRRLEEVSKCQADLAESLREATEASRRGLAELQGGFSRLQRSTERPVEELAKELESFVATSTTEQTRLRDAIAALQNEARIEQQRGDRRVDELVRRHHDLVRNSLLELDTQAGGLRDEMQGMLRTHARQAAEERDAVQHHVARLQGALEATNDTTTRWVTELRSLMEENIARRSEIRSCFRDCNRLEMLLGGASPSDAARAERRDVSRGPVDSRAGGATVHPGELRAVKEKISNLFSRTEKVEQQVAQMDEAWRHLFAGGNGGVGFTGAAAAAASSGGGGGEGHMTFINQDSRQAMSGSRIERPRPLQAKSILAASHIQTSQITTPMNMRGLPQHQMTPASVSQVHSPMGVMGGMHGESPVQSSSAASPMSFHSRGAYDPRMHQQQQQQQQQQQYYMHHQQQHQHHHHQMSHHQMHHYQQMHQQQQQQKPGATRLVGSHSRSRLLHGPLEQSAEHSGVSHVRSGDFTASEVPPQHPSNTQMLDTTLPGRGHNKPSSPLKEAPAKSRSPTPSDSYVSDGGKDLKEDSSMQYIPAPTSDIESEMENKKMARLALD